VGKTFTGEDKRNNKYNERKEKRQLKAMNYIQEEEEPKKREKPK